MPRKKLEKKSEYIQLVIASDDKQAFDAWCAHNSTTMSEVIRTQIAPYISKGRKLLEAIALQQQKNQLQSPQTQSQKDS